MGKTPRHWKVGDRVRTRGLDAAPIMILNRFGQYGPEVECVWFERGVGQKLWINAEVLEHVV